MKKIMSLIFACFMSACSFIPNANVPDAPVAGFWPFGNEETTDAPMLQDVPMAAEIGWRTFFKSGTMRAVIETALDNNRDLQEAALNIEAARAQYGITRFELYPRLQGRTDATLQHQSDDLTITGFDDNTQTYEAAVSLPAYEIDLFGRLRSLKRSALEDYLATAAAQQAAKIALIGETARSYLVLL